MKRRTFINLTGWSVTAISLFNPSLNFSASHTNKKKQPNIVYIVIDNVTFEHVKESYTPHMDRIAAEGVDFKRMYVPMSICVPSRYSILSGRYPERCTAPFVLDKLPMDQPWDRNNVELELDRPNIAKVLKSSGYTTGYVGKFHVHHTSLMKKIKLEEGENHISNPKVTKALQEWNDAFIKVLHEHGFDYAGGAEYGNGIPIKNVDMDGSRHNLEWEIKNGLDFIDRNKNSSKPFFLYLSTQLLHYPLDVKKTMLSDYEKVGRYSERGLLPKAPEVPMLSRKELVKQARANGPDEDWAICMHWLDAGIGAVIKKLGSIKKLKNTIVIVLSDNNQGGKSTVYESGVRVPAMMMWPEKIPPGQACSQIVSSLDIVPTLFDAGQAEAPSDMKLDGRSFLHTVTGKPNHSIRDAFLVMSGHARGLVTEKWKYVAVRYPKEVQKKIKEFEDSRRKGPDLKGRPLMLWKRSVEPKLHASQKPYAYNKYRWHIIENNHMKHIHNFPYIFDADQLYDLESDPNEQVNLGGQKKYKEKLEEMKRLLKQELKPLTRPFGEFKK